MKNLHSGFFIPYMQDCAAKNRDLANVLPCLNEQGCNSMFIERAKLHE